MLPVGKNALPLNTTRQPFSLENLCAVELLLPIGVYVVGCPPDVSKTKHHTLSTIHGSVYTILALFMHDNHSASPRRQVYRGWGFGLIGL